LTNNKAVPHTWGMAKELRAYIDILEDKANEYAIDLKSAFMWKDISDTTYYRTVNRQTDMSYATARKVNDSIEELRVLRDHRAKLKK